MNQTIEEGTRRQIAVFLPQVLGKALESYHAFMDSAEVPVAPKEGATDQDTRKKAIQLFGEHHTACKAAISHIELLLKLAQWAELPDSRQDGENLIELIKIAQKDIENYRKREVNPGES